MSNGHPYEPAVDGNYCATPDFGDHICAKPPGHPIHATGRPDIDRLAQALLAHPWRFDRDSLREQSEHRRHNYSYDCALCTQDVHLIAAFFIDHFNAS